MIIPKSVMIPFGVIGIPQVFCREMAENFLAAAIKDIVEQMEERQKEERDNWVVLATADPVIQSIIRGIEKRNKE